MGGGKNPTYPLIFSKMLFRIFFISTIVMQIHVVKKVVVGTQCTGGVDELNSVLK